MPGQPTTEKPEFASLADLHAQKKADEAFADLLASESPTAGLKAFGTGLAAGAAIPLAMSLTGWGLGAGSHLQAVEQRAHLAHMVEQRGLVPKGKGNEVAAALQQVLSNPSPITEQVEQITNQLRAGVSGDGIKVPGFKDDSGTFLSAADARRVAADMAEERGVSADAIFDAVTSRMKPATVVSPRPAQLAATLPSGAVGADILEQAALSFQAAGNKPVSYTKPLLASLGKHLKASVPSALLLGAPAGIWGAMRHHKKKKRLAELRKSAAQVVPQKTYWSPESFRKAFRALVPDDQAKPTETPLIITKKASERYAGDGEASMHPDEPRGRFIAHAMWDELEKIGQGMAAGAGPVGPGQKQETGQLQGSIGQGSDAGEEEASPAHGVVASRIEQLDDKQARGIPVIQPPPGYVYAPDLGAFVPNEGDPGWMAQEQALEAQRNKGWFDAGQQNVHQQSAQAETDAVVQENTQAALQQQAAAQQQAMTEQAAAQQGTAEAVKEQAKEQAQTPPGVLGASTIPDLKAPAGSSRPKSKPKSDSSSKGEKGVTIKIGKP